VARRKLDINAAALVLGISSDAVRKRAERGTLESERDERGHVFVWLDTDETDDQPRSESPAVDLLSEKDQRIEDLRDQLDGYQRLLEAEQESSRELRRIVAALTQRIPELGPAESRETGAQAPREAEEGRGPGPVGGEAERGTGRSWWRRLLGG